MVNRFFLELICFHARAGFDHVGGLVNKNALVHALLRLFDAFVKYI